jgi:ABC-type lipoprotein release transport system permease subunit
VAIPWSYSLRNLAVRRLTTVLTAAGMGMVVFVFAAMEMMAGGLEATLAGTGSPDNAVVIRRSSGTEVQSSVDRASASIVESQPEVALGPDGRPLAARESVVLINLLQRGDGRPANVVIRGVGPASLALRPQVLLVAGRWPKPGSLEVAAGAGIARRFLGTGLGERLRFAQGEWTVVGLFAAGASAFDSEIWGNAEQLQAAFRRPIYSSVVLRLRDSRELQGLKERLEEDPRLTLEVKRETRFWSDQSEGMATFLRILGTALSVIFSLGAVIGAMITMYAAVASRVPEIGMLRALGFRSGSILAAFLLESSFLGLLGGVAGLLGASLLQSFTVSTMNWQTFSELAFSFTLTPTIAGKSILFALAMGTSGGLLPAFRAARLGIVEALRTG